MPVTINSLRFIPQELQKFELYPKVCSLIDYLINNELIGFDDVRLKYTKTYVSNEVTTELVKELGFGYIGDIIDTLNNVELRLLNEFSGLINILKGSRYGLELVLKLLGFDYFLKEWWESTFFPAGEPHSFDIVVFMNPANVSNPHVTLRKIKDFIEHYVYPKARYIDWNFGETIGRKYVGFGGFYKRKFSTVKIVGRIATTTYHVPYEGK